MHSKLNVLIVGNGHYATGSTVLEGKVATDKDYGVLLPAILELRKQNIVGEVYLAAKDGRKFPALRKKLNSMHKEFGWDTDIETYPMDGAIEEKAYQRAMEDLPRSGGALIAVPDKLHKEVIMDAIRNGHHFFVVKPAVVKTKDLLEVMHSQEKAGVLGMVDYHKCFDEVNLILREEYRKGAYGRLQHVFTKMTQRRDMLEIFGNWLKNSDTNINHYLGSHYIHLTGFITEATPVSVRATAQFGVAREEFGIDTPDLIETQIEWKSRDNSRFISYHVAGWADPSETASMTYQEIHLIGTKAHVESDQRYRGYQTALVGKGQQIVNPYFFNLHRGINGDLDLESKYGFRSVKTFVKAALEVNNGVKIAKFENRLPTIRESRNVTAILEAADLSLKEGSKIVSIGK